MNQLSASDSLPVLFTQQGSRGPASHVSAEITKESLAVPLSSWERFEFILLDAFSDGIKAGVRRWEKEMAGRN